LIASTGETEAKNLGSCPEKHHHTKKEHEKDLIPEHDKLPTIEIFEADESYALDCWIVVHEAVHHEDYEDEEH
jgi:hypothetical protein